MPSNKDILEYLKNRATLYGIEIIRALDGDDQNTAMKARAVQKELEDVINQFSEINSLTNLDSDTVYCTTKEAASLLNKHPSTITRMLNEKRLKGKYYNGKWWIPQSEITKNKSK